MPFASSAGPTIGRESELEQFDDALESLGATSSACIAVEGEPGIGKTRLLAEVRLRAEERGCLVLGGAATEFERELPFGVWTDAMDAYVASQELDLHEHWSAELVAELGEIVPSSQRASRRSSRAVADERYRTHRAARELLELLARDRPLVVVLDDLHWGDEASIELLATLLRRGADAPVLLALAFRPGQAPARLSAALATSSALRISLEPLTEAQATALLADVDPGTAAAMYRHGGGNPLYLEQLRRAAGDGTLEATPAEGDDPVRLQAWPCRPPLRRRWPGSSHRSRPRSSRCSAPPRSPVSPSRSISRHPSPSSTRRTGSRRWTRCSRSTWSVRRRFRAGSRFATPSCGVRSTSRPRPAGDSGRTRARRPSWPSGAPRRPSAPTTSSSTPAAATRRRSR